MKKFLVTNPNDAVLLFLRLSLGLIMFLHGAQKLLGWFGGFGFGGTMDFFTHTMSLPWLIGFLVIVIEFFGSLALIAGAATRLMALGITAIMVGAVVTSHLQHGFFMNWYANQQGEGFEYHLLVIALAVALIVRGGGKLSVDSAIGTRAGRTHYQAQMAPLQQ